MLDTTTTIKVPRSLRERVAREAAEAGLTAAGLISALLDEHDRAARFAAVKQAHARPDITYATETAAWDVVIDE